MKSITAAVALVLVGPWACWCTLLTQNISCSYSWCSIHVHVYILVAVLLYDDNLVSGHMICCSIKPPTIQWYFCPFIQRKQCWICFTYLLTYSYCAACTGGHRSKGTVKCENKILRGNLQIFTHYLLRCFTIVWVPALTSVVCDPTKLLVACGNCRLWCT